MFVRRNQIESKPQPVVKCAKGSGEVIPATTVYKPLLLSYLIGLQFIYSGITLIYLFIFLVGFHVHEILDLRGRLLGAWSQCSDTIFYKLSVTSMWTSWAFFQIQAYSDYTLVQNPLTGSTGSADYVQVTYWTHVEAGPDHRPCFLFLPKTVAAAPKFQVQTTLFNGIWL